MVFKKFPGAVFVQRNGLTRVFANVFQRSRDRGQIPSRLATPVLQRPAAAKKSSKGGGMIVAGPALELAPLDRLILRVGEYQRTDALCECRGSQRNEDDQCRDNAKKRKAKDQKARGQTRRRTPTHCEHHCPVSVAMTFQLG